MALTLTISATDDDIRLDRWFKRHHPQVTHGNLVKLLRKGDVRVNGKKVESSYRVKTGDSVRLPAFVEKIEKQEPRGKTDIPDSELHDIKKSVLFDDEFVVAINKKPGIAVQGGTGTHVHIDGMLDVLKGKHSERPKLVHRLDKDTSGVLLLARSAKSANFLMKAFQGRETKKIYWAVVKGVPKHEEGKINLRIRKMPGAAGEKMVVDEEGDSALTFYRVLDAAGQDVALLELEPVTGRTHQLRVHASALGTPILGDGKYGGKEAMVQGAGVSRKLHLHARAITFPHPKKGEVTIKAPLPKHMEDTLRFFNFDVSSSVIGG